MGWASTGVRDDGWLAGIYTQIYMALMRNISIFFTSTCSALHVLDNRVALLVVFV